MNPDIKFIEDLSRFVNRGREIRKQEKDLMEQAKEHDKEFNNWLQSKTDIEDTNQTYHLSEILLRLVEKNINVTKHN